MTPPTSMGDRESAGYGGGLLSVPEDPRLLIEVPGHVTHKAARVAEILRSDSVALLRDVSPSEADGLIREVAILFDLQEQLDLHAAFAAVRGQRERSGECFMTVNARGAYQIFGVHSEGDRDMGIQLAALHCAVNTTDGGYNILMNIDGESPEWENVLCESTKMDLGNTPLSRADVASLRARHRIHLPRDLLQPGDRVMNERDSPIPGTRIFTALTKAERVYSKVLERNTYVYWDSVSSSDRDVFIQYVDLLRNLDLLREPASSLSIEDMDYSRARRLWSSGIDYGRLFKSMLVLKLRPGDLIIQNNLTWTHSATNWTPSSGDRKVVAAFA